MNKTEFIKAVADSADLTKASAERVVNAFIDTVTLALSQSDPVALTGFGTFSTAARAARTGRNPQTGEPLEISATTLPKFKPGKSLKEQVNSAQG